MTGNTARKEWRGVARMFYLLNAAIRSFVTGWIRNHSIVSDATNREAVPTGMGTASRREGSSSNRQVAPGPRTN